MRRETLTLNRPNQHEKGAACQQPLSIASIVDRLDINTTEAAYLARFAANLEEAVQAWRDRARRHYRQGGRA